MTVSKSFSKAARNLLDAIEHWGGEGVGSAEIRIQAGYWSSEEDGRGATGRSDGAFLSCLRGLIRRGLVRDCGAGSYEITDAGRAALTH